jgi:hypothetical protein
VPDYSEFFEALGGHDRYALLGGRQINMITESSRDCWWGLSIVLPIVGARGNLRRGSMTTPLFRGLKTRSQSELERLALSESTRKGPVMSVRSPMSMTAIAAVAALILAACGSSDASREAAGAGGLPDCAEGLAAECIVTIPGGTEPIAVSNGALVTFADQGQPVNSVTASRICWSEEGDVDASTCATTEAELPAWVSVQRTAVDRAGTAWPSLRLRFLDVADSAGEEFVPLPATVSVLLDGVSGPSAVNLEIACCDRAADSSAAAVQGSTAAYITLANELTLPDGTPVSVTWQVTDTKNEFWDGSSRPDHAPPQGLQGLVQASGSGEYKVRTEVADQWGIFTENPNFTLTPVIEVDGQRVVLDPWLLVYLGGWQLLLDNQEVDGCRTAPSFTASTPQGELRYLISGTCGRFGGVSSFTLELSPE